MQGTDGVQALGLSDGPSRRRGTHQRPSQPRRASVKQGPFAHAGLCCPQRSITTTTPSDSLSAARHFPGPPVIDGHAPDPRRVGAEEGLSSSRDTLLHVPRPLRRSSSAPAPGSQAPSMAFAKSTQARHPLFPAEAGAFTTLQTSPHAADRAVAPPRFEPGLSTEPGDFATEDPGVSPDRTHTGWLPRASRPVTS